MELDGTQDEVLARAAANWLQRLQTADAKEHAEFARWLRQSPAHVREVLLASSWEVVLHHLGHVCKVDAGKLLAACSNVVPVRGARPPSAPARARMLWRPWIAATAIVAAVLVGTLPLLREVLRHEYTTAIGEQRAISLEDGSVISLNARSGVRVDFTHAARDVYLTGGQALFTVARDRARPFRVHAGNTVVQAIGTKFDMRQTMGRVDVAVLEGRVQIFGESLKGSELGEGEALSISGVGQISAPAKIDIAEISAWRQRRLVFRDRPLSEIVEEFQRYNRRPRMRVEGDELRARTFNGVFDADDPQTLAAYLATDETITVERRGDELVIRPRTAD